MKIALSLTFMRPTTPKLSRDRVYSRRKFHGRQHKRNAVQRLGVHEAWRDFHCDKLSSQRVRLFADGVHCKGNLGLYDQYTAIEWIRHNVSAFGGDPDNITLMGQSAGAMSIQTLICSDYLKGKVKGAIMLSGGGNARRYSRCQSRTRDIGKTRESKRSKLF